MVAIGDIFKRGIRCTLDAWVMAASVSGAEHPTCTRLWYIVPAILHRRQLQRLQASKGGERKPYGGTRSLGLKRGTLVRHPKYGLCTIGGFDRKKQTISLHDYRTNKRLTHAAKVKACRILGKRYWRMDRHRWSDPSSSKRCGQQLNRCLSTI